MKNPDAEKSNAIHSTSGARDYGFQGALVGGATAYGWAASFFVETLGTPPVVNVLVLDGASFEPNLVSGAVTLIPHDGAPLIRGDASQDGTLDLADGVGILQYLFIGAAADCLDALDANDSGNVSITDAIRVLCALYCSGSPPPEGPFPDCGFDSTADSIDCLSYPGCP
jgi:Ca2+-binding RTX toxin-like protein